MAGITEAYRTPAALRSPCPPLPQPGFHCWLPFVTYFSLKGHLIDVHVILVAVENIKEMYGKYIFTVSPPQSGQRAWHTMLSEKNVKGHLLHEGPFSGNGRMCWPVLT